MDLTHAPSKPATDLGLPYRPGGLAFLREAARSFRTTGAVAPSSGPLAARLAAPLAMARAEFGGPVSVLEVGAGTGPVTRTLAGRLGPADRLDVVEINPRFVEVLYDALHTDPALSAASDRIRIIADSITDTDLDRRYDVIVSCLPFTNFEPHTVRSILDRYLSVLEPGGHLTYFAYVGTQATRALVADRAEAARHRASSAVLDGFATRYGVGDSLVLRNLPPARVHHLRAPGPLGRSSEAPAR
ncbi:phosphatidylethanolamine/phosphatidyl-N-methylethanolamine N-methyltransferase [Streptomyces sp. LBL]|uniref:class I SAM-dependent methyltransferase n=1 Tax=Streptomyces sp. LBL TaxID=2940562 RepID=UPI0024764DBC|nr:methyltransferase domain-containing protein [Streptomyces sp. LBL]MDH6629093.1 phosphatidylethanolamine/phosphatidyl-N-methylethanolamine N-methyltransferase [Streptomyces sp. LBL]